VNDAFAFAASIITSTATATVFIVMFALGLTLDACEMRWWLGRPGLVARALGSVFLVVPAVAIATGYLLGLSREGQVAIALMAVSPGAPVALRRSIQSGSHHSFAAVLQGLVAALAIVTMPLAVIVLNAIYGTHGSIAPALVAKQVSVTQLLPLGAGLVLRAGLPALAIRVEPIVRRIAALMLAGFLVAALLALGPLVLGAAAGTLAAVTIITVIALAAGHALGGPDEDTRRAVAFVSAIKNAGLALLVASANHAPPEVMSTLLAYLFWAAIVVMPYVMWRRRVTPRA
jgi:BASS family bile acid:Na+ symporter